MGKTTLARKICALLPDAVRIKIGCGREKPDVDDVLYRPGTPARTVLDNHAQARFLVIESNSILAELAPDLCVYVDADNPKQSAQHARAKADVTTAQVDPIRDVPLIRQRLDLDLDTARAVFRCIEEARGPAHR